MLRFSPEYLFVKVCCLSLNTLNPRFNSYIPSSETRGKYICLVFSFLLEEPQIWQPWGNPWCLTSACYLCNWPDSLKYPLRRQLIWVVFFDLGLSRSDLAQNVYSEDYLWEVSAVSLLNRNFPPSQGFKHKINFKTDCRESIPLLPNLLSWDFLFFHVGKQCIHGE